MTPEWEIWNPPFDWPKFGVKVIADRHLDDGTRQHVVDREVAEGTVWNNAQIFGPSALESCDPS